MQKYEVNGQLYELPDDMDDGTAWELIRQDQGLDERGNKLRTKPSPVNTLINPEDLANDPDYLHAANVVWRHKNGKDFDGKPEDLAAYGLSTIRWINSNSVNAAVTAAMTVMEDDEYKQSLKHLFEKHDTIKYSLSGFMENAAAQFADPLNWVSAGTFGVAATGGQAAKMLSKEALVQALKLGYREGLINSVTSATQDYLTQKVKTNVGAQDGVDYGDVALAGALGGATGAALSAVGDLAVTGVKQALGKGAAKSVPGGTPNAAPGSPEQALEAVPVGAEPRLGSPGSPGAEIMDAGAGLVKIDPKPLPGQPEILPPWKTNPIIDAVNDNAADTGMRVQPVGKEALSNAGKPAVDEILALDEFSLKTLLEEARKEGFRGESNQVFKASLAEATQKLLTDLTEADDLGQMYHAYKRLELIRGADLDFSSASGRDLSFRVGMINTGDFRDVTPESILRDWNIDPFHATPEQKDRAMQAFQQKIVDKLEEVKINREYQRMTDEIDELGKQGRFTEAAKMHAEREALKESLTSYGPGTGPLSLKAVSTKAVNALTEIAISNVFTPKTVVMNVVPSAISTFARPALDVVVKGPSPKAVKEMAAAYGMIASSQKVAMKAAVAAFRYEANLLGQNLDKPFNKLLERSPVFDRRHGGGVLRIFPRLLTSTDEYFSQLNYRAFVASRAAGEAYDLGVSQGLKGGALDAFVKKEVESYVEHAFAPVGTSSAIDFLRVQGISNGLKGDELSLWISRELNKNKSLFDEATGDYGRWYANDIAFKRAFSGDNWQSTLAKDYEDFVNRHPTMRLFGQLFFRTPVRVFQDAFRLTPMVQFIDQSFIRDLMGHGVGGMGGPAQIKAQGQALLSVVLASSALVMYANGQISGAGAGMDWRQRRTMTNPDWQPYTVDMGDGTKFNFRNWDPMIGPWKIVVNSLEKLHLLQYRKGQGENIGKEENEALASLVSASFGIVQSVRDASLVEGVDQVADFIESLFDAENHESKLVRFFGQKFQMLIPSTIGRVGTAMSDNPTSPDPATIEQFIRAKLNPEDPLVPRIYDPTGNPIAPNASFGMLFGLDLTTPESRSTGDEALDQVRRELASLTVQTGKAFIAPYDGAKFAPGPLSAAYKGVDLRTKYVQDMSETYYDRLQRYTVESGVVGMLYNALVDSPIPTGTWEDGGPKVKLVQKIINNHRKMAWLRLMQEEPGILDNNVYAIQEQAKNRAGFRDNANIPFGNR